MSVKLSPFFMLAVAGLLSAQPPQKKVITHRDYEIWNSESGMTLSRDGQWIVYTLTPPQGDRYLVIRNLTTSIEHRIAMGGRPSGEGENPNIPPANSPSNPPATPPSTGAAATSPGRLGTGSISGVPTFTPDGTKLIAVLSPTKADWDKAKESQAKPEDQPKTVVAVIELMTGKVVEKIAKIKSFRLIEEKPGYLILHKESAPEPEKTEVKPNGEKSKETTPEPKAKPDADFEQEGQPPTGAGQGRGGRSFRQGTAPPATGTPAATASRPNFGTDLVIRNLGDGKVQTYTDIVEYIITKDARHLVATTSRRDADATVSFGELGKSEKLTPIRTGKFRFSRLAWDSKQTKMVFFAEDLPTEKKEEKIPATTPLPKSPTVYLWERGAKDTTAIVTPETKGLNKGLSLSDRTLSFSSDGGKISLTVIPVPPGQDKQPTVTAADKVDLDLWHWKDENIQPMQKVRSSIDRNKSYSALFDFATKKLVQLSDEDRTVGVPSYGDWSIGSLDKPYRFLTGYGPSLRDYMFVNIKTGEAKSVVKASPYGVSLSPKSTRAIRFDGKDWWSISIPSGEAINLTAKIPTKFFDDELDTPSEPQPTAFPQWTSDEKSVLISDKHDIWKVAVDGSSVLNLTSIGREQGIRFRLLRLDLDESPDEETGLDLNKPYLLSATNLNTFDTGFYRLEPGQKPKLLMMAARQFGVPVKAKSGDIYLIRSQTFYDPNDFYVTDSSFREIRRVTEINPKVREFNWGRAELIHYQNDEGVKLKGMLIKPEDFDPNKQYPMIVYIYEKLSQGLHQFRLPSAGTSINPTFYASNGYLVFMPDIVYTIGSPGQSALKCVLPAIQAVINRGYVKEDSIGIQGHSWGGYQIAYMITQTNRFKAASAGAPVSNMVSAYGGIRWGTGLPREFQYERTQSRIGATLWAAPNKFIENSPIFYADRVKTPLIMLHNDQDDAVPWYQGIEYYLALRRLGKEVYLFNYNGEFHGLRKKATQRDYTLRMQQFFDHYLKGAPMPDWMAKGIPFNERDKEKEQWKDLFTPEKK